MKRYISYILFVVVQSAGIASAGVLECIEDSDCIASDASCVDSLCECPKGKIFRADYSACSEYVTKYKGECVDTQQCAWLLGEYSCSSGVCVCSDGWRLYQGKCIAKKGLNEECTKDLDCYNGYDMLAMTCTNGTCACSENYYLRGDYDCRPRASDVGDECALDSDCVGDNVVCKNARCQTNSRDSRFSQYQEDISNECAVDDDCLAADAICENAKCQRVAKQTVETYNESRFISERNGSMFELDANCTADDDCGITNAVCSPLTKKCTCKRGYFYDASINDLACIGELGVNVGCQNDSDCPIKPGKCVDGACFCTTFRFYGEGNRKCYKSMTQTNFNCTSNEWCLALGNNAYCSSNNTCVCSGNAELDENYVCRATTESCTNETECSADSDCGTANAECTDQKCVCKQGYRQSDGTCLPNIGSVCSTSSPCTIANATCDDSNICSCEDGYVSNDSLSCTVAATSLGDSCSFDVECTEYLENTQCLDEICTCQDGYLERSGSCYEERAMGSYCTSTFQCTVVMNSTVQCRNSKCQCGVGYEVTDDGLGCKVSSASVPLTVTLLISLILPAILVLIA